MNAPELPLVSVCIPTYNRAARLQRAVEKLRACSYPRLEIIISDNASSDDTQAVCEELGRGDSRIRYFRHASNRGMIANFEFARAQATGTYFLWLGDDDYLAPDYIALCVQELERDRALVLCAGVAAYHRGDLVVRRYGNVIQCEARSPLLRILKYLMLVGENSIFQGVYRRESVLRCTLPRSLCGDWQWLAEVLAEGPARVLPQAHVYREESDNTSQSIERIVTVLGLPAWNARAPWLVMPLLLAKYLAFQSAAYRSKPLVAKLARWFAVFTVSFTRQVILAVGPKIPFAGTLRRFVASALRA